MSESPFVKLTHAHRAHVVAGFLAGAKMRAVLVCWREPWAGELTEWSMVPLCARSRGCAHCATFKRALATMAGSYLEVGLIHYRSPAAAPREAEHLAEGASV